MRTKPQNKRLVAEVYLRDVNKRATRNTRHANNNVHAKGLARKKRSASRVETGESLLALMG